MAGLFGSITIKGNRLTDFAGQTSTVGIPIPFGFGKYPVDGNIIFAALPPKEHVKKKKQGKGGVRTEEYSYTMSYAIAFCEGPIFGFLTIKRNGKVVWTQDPNASVEDKEYSQKWAQKATFYLGTKTQLPDSTIESYKGAGRVSAFRNLAYIVVEDDDVTDNGGAVPSYEAVVIASPPDVYLTSRPYHIVDINGISVSSSPLDGRGFGITSDSTILGAYALNGSLRSVLNYYDISPESIQVVNSYALNGQLREVLQRYEISPDSVAVVNSYALNGEIKDVLLRYTNYAPEPISVSSLALNGSKT